jgi:hypothetical protein
LAFPRTDRRLSTPGPVTSPCGRSDQDEAAEIATTSLDEARAFIASVTWVFAKTRAEFNPHEYAVERTEGGPPFAAFVELVRSTPIRRWRGGRYHCLTVDDHDYWLTHGGAAGWIVNRKPTDRAGWDPEPAPSRDPSEIVWHDFERDLIDEERRDMLLRELENRD